MSKGYPLHNRRYFLNLTASAINVLSVAVAFLIGCSGWRIAKNPDLALKVANTQLVTTSSANKLEELTAQLENQAKAIETKEQAFDELQTVYEQSLKNEQGYERLKQKIERIEILPEVENLEQIKTEIAVTEELLEEIITE